ncbi:P2 family phage major capsid protein [Rodentibacter heidelbergensis]|uniref:P2 family phage major capsid protein n=1 Tax=Rodentibacter heidelbergensis TaxID=1908258 RepID=UPI000984E7BE|nr:P2 family phage major capsid protein [Rodentibacter heidelbergensis]
MQKLTQEKFTAYKNELEGVEMQEYSHFNDHAKVEKIIKQGIKNHAFLGLITTKFVEDSPNKTYALSLPIVSNTDTDKHAREPRNIVQDITPFECAQINLDVRLLHSELDLFTEIDFEKALNARLGGELAKNLTMVGFHGTHRAEDSDPQAHPLGEDMAKGWHAQLKEKAQVIQAGELSGQTTAQLIKKALEKLPVTLQESGDLIAICGRNVLDGALIQLEPKQLNAQNGVLLIAQNLIGGLRAINAPFFPANCILITTLSNLAIYLKQNTARLFFKQEVREDSLNVYFSVQLDYLLENYRHAVLIEGIEGRA